MPYLWRFREQSVSQNLGLIHLQFVHAYSLMYNVSKNRVTCTVCFWVKNQHLYVRSLTYDKRNTWYLTS